MCTVTLKRMKLTARYKFCSKIAYTYMRLGQQVIDSIFRLFKQVFSVHAACFIKTLN